MSFEKFQENAERVHKGKFSYHNVLYKNNKTKVEVICPFHGSFYVAPVHHVYNKIGCPKCSGSHKRTTEEFIKDAKEIHSDTYDYSLTEFKTTATDVKVICKKHGLFVQKADYHLRGSGCPKCNISKGEKEVMDGLKSLRVDFIHQKSFGDCLSLKGRRLRFDFYLPEYNTCIEFDGRQHFIELEINRKRSSLEYIRENDSIKNDYCIFKGIRLIRIPYYKQKEIFSILKQIK